MTPKEQAKELVTKYHKLLYSYVPITESLLKAKECALICVDSHNYSENNSPFHTLASWIEDSTYWREVRKEIKQYKIDDTKR